MKSDADLLKWLAQRDAGMTARQIAEGANVARNTVIKTLWKIDTQLAASEGKQ